jgi:hypothetical protein
MDARLRQSAFAPVSVEALAKLISELLCRGTSGASPNGVGRVTGELYAEGVPAKFVQRPWAKRPGRSSAAAKQHFQF